MTMGMCKTLGGWQDKAVTMGRYTDAAASNQVNNSFIADAM
jgi:hypothetical protein